MLKEKLDNVRIVTPLLVFFICLIFLGCKTKSGNVIQNENDKIVASCWEKWTMNDLKGHKEVKILLHNQGLKSHMSNFCNFLIGVCEGDTVGIYEKDFKGKIVRGDLVKISPISWSVDEKNLIKPLYTISKSKEENLFYCNVKIAYYATIEINKDSNYPR